MQERNRYQNPIRGRDAALYADAIPLALNVFAMLGTFPATV